MYRENYGGEIGSKRWLRQFQGKSTEDELAYKKNIAAISGAQVGLKKSLPLFAGIHVVYIVYALIVGFGMGLALQTFPELLTAMKLIGALFVIWLGISLWRRPKSRELKVRMGFKEGVVLHALNPKYPVVLLTMYSTFLIETDPILWQVLTLSFSICLLNVFTQLVWCSAGMFLGRSFTSDESGLVQDRVFSVLLVLVGLWIALR